MIRNLIFDFGQVLIQFVPKSICSDFVKNEEDIEVLTTVLFDRLYWDALDRGTITDEEIMALARPRLPQHLWAVAEQILKEWIYHIPEIQGMNALVARMKEKGLRLFLLSNISTHFAEHAHEYPVLSNMEKCIFSATCGHVKPERDMFEYACNTFDVVPEETIFIDDNEKNILGAQSVGLRTYLFDGDVEKLDAYLENILQS